MEWETQLNKSKTKKNEFVVAVSEEVGYALHSTLSHDIKKDLHEVLTNDV